MQYNYNVVDGKVTEQCPVVEGVKIGSISCQNCPNCEDFNIYNHWVICHRLTEPMDILGEIKQSNNEKNNE